MSQATERQIHLIAAFLRGKFGVPAPVDKVLTTPLSREPRATLQSRLRCSTVHQDHFPELASREAQMAAP